MAAAKGSSLVSAHAAAAVDQRADAGGSPQAYLLIDELSKRLCLIVKLFREILVISGKSLPERREIHASLDLVEAGELAVAGFPQRVVHLIHRAFHEISDQVDVRPVVQHRSVPRHERGRIQLSELVERWIHSLG